MPSTIDEILVQARSRLRRLAPDEVVAILGDGGLLIDIRPHRQRLAEGEVPDALIIERNVLEWRLDLQAPTCIRQVTGYDQPIVIMCSEGYTSSLAAAALQDMGFVRATDLAGGFVAWSEQGLPTRPGGTPAIP